MKPLKIISAVLCVVAGLLIWRTINVWPNWELVILYSIMIGQILFAVVLFIFFDIIEDPFDEESDVDNVHSIGLMKPGPYIIYKRDGSPVDQDAEYFVLRLDLNGDDPEHTKACRIAINAYAMNISHHLPLLAKDLMDKYGSVHAK